VRSARFRSVARVFAILLLAWTTADLCGHGLCVHDREPIVPWTSSAPGGRTSAVRAPAGAPIDTATSNGPDDCFCCCHCVDVNVPFQMPVICTFVSSVFTTHSSLPHLSPSPLYHPPLA
jgi:hypothetical protein